MEDWLKKIREDVAEERRNYKGPYCCLTMDCELSRENTLLYYNLKYREHGIKIYKTNRYLLIVYCICCGKKLPSSLRIEWAETLKKEYGLSDPINHHKKQIPKEFLTDEWWKNKIFSNVKQNQAIKNNNKEEFFKQRFYCCNDLYTELLNDGSLLHYSMKYREYGINVPKSSTVMIMDYCLFCGTQFPTSVRDPWFDILEQEYGLEWPTTSDKKKVPKEFLTDEWWKKRDL